MSIVTKDAAKAVCFLLLALASLVGAGLFVGHLAERKVESVRAEIRRIAIEAVTTPTNDQRKESGE